MLDVSRRCTRVGELLIYTIVCRLCAGALGLLAEDFHNTFED